MYSFRPHQQQRLILSNIITFQLLLPCVLVDFHKHKLCTFKANAKETLVHYRLWTLLLQKMEDFAHQVQYSSKEKFDIKFEEKISAKICNFGQKMAIVTGNIC
jgi:hypothetical protein